MKRRLALVLVLMGGAACAFAQTNVTVPAKPEPIKIMGDEAVHIQQTIHGYVQGALHRDRLKLFDRKKGKDVILRLDRIAIDDPERAVFVKTNEVAICCEFTEIASVIGEKSEIQEKGTGDKYEVWFLLQRGYANPNFSKVLKLYIKSVNGVPMNIWTQDESGNWSATLAPDAK